MISQNNKGQISKDLSILLTKKLRSIANDCENQVKIVLRDELEARHKQEIYASYTPIQVSGKKVDKYNKTHAHQKKQPYHHTKTLINSVKGVIDGNTVKIVLENRTYDDTDKTSVEDVYEYLDKGTKPSEYDVYIMKGHNSHTPYVSQEPIPAHNFRKKTLISMNEFINHTLIPDIEAEKYLRKTRKGAK